MSRRFRLTLRSFFPRVDHKWRDPNIAHQKPNPWRYRPQPSNGSISSKGTQR